MYSSYSVMGSGESWKSQLLRQKVVYLDGGSSCKRFTNGKTSIFDDGACSKMLQGWKDKYVCERKLIYISFQSN